MWLRNARHAGASAWEGRSMRSVADGYSLYPSSLFCDYLNSFRETEDHSIIFQSQNTHTQLYRDCMLFVEQIKKKKAWYILSVSPARNQYVSFSSSEVQFLVCVHVMLLFFYRFFSLTWKHSFLSPQSLLDHIHVIVGPLEHGSPQ